MIDIIIVNPIIVPAFRINGDGSGLGFVVGGDTVGRDPGFS